VRRNKAGAEGGGGIYNDATGTVTLDEATSVTDNVPDDCVGTPVC
jgi:hypothetical protein